MTSDRIAAIETHARACWDCQELLSAVREASSRRPSPDGALSTGDWAGRRSDLSCRFLVPLLDLAGERIPASDLTTFLAYWRTTVAALREETGWVSLRFCEALTEWLAQRVGADVIIERTLRDSYSPKAMGMLYPFVRAFGSPRVGYGQLPSLVRLMNRASDVQVLAIKRNRATVVYRPLSEETRERSPLICQVRRAQIAAGPRIWNLPDAVVKEAECQAHGGDRCVYQLAWVEPSRWWKAVLAGCLIAVLLRLAAGGGWTVIVLGALCGIVGASLWGTRRDLRELRSLEEMKMSMLSRLMRPAAASGAPEADASASAAAASSGSLHRLLAAPPQPGELLAGRYRLGRLLGAGGMAFVFSARDETEGETVALKLLRPELTSNPRWVARMEREIRIGRTIEHPHVCRVISFGHVDGNAFLTMELATGGSLSRELRAATTRSWTERMTDAKAIVAGLAAVHQAGIVHRDVTPQNILRFDGGRLAIADFGLALDEPGRTTTVAGTPRYMPPEVLAGGKASCASDVWQLGMVLHEVLFGDRPDPNAPLVPRAPEQQPLFDLCLMCLRADPAQRPTNAGTVANALARLAN